MVFEVWGLGFGVLGLGFEVWGSGFRLSGPVCWVWYSWSRVQCVGCGVRGLGIKDILIQGVRAGISGFLARGWGSRGWEDTQRRLAMFCGSQDCACPWVWGLWFRIEDWDVIDKALGLGCGLEFGL